MFNYPSDLRWFYDNKNTFYIDHYEELLVDIKPIRKEKESNSIILYVAGGTIDFATQKFADRYILRTLFTTFSSRSYLRERKRVLGNTHPT